MLTTVSTKSSIQPNWQVKVNALYNTGPYLTSCVDTTTSYILCPSTIIHSTVTKIPNIKDGTCTSRTSEQALSFDCHIGQREGKRVTYDEQLNTGYWTELWKSPTAKKGVPHSKSNSFLYLLSISRLGLPTEKSWSQSSPDYQAPCSHLK